MSSEFMHLIPALILIAVSLLLGCLKGYKYSKLVSTKSLMGWVGIVSVTTARSFLAFAVLLVAFQFLFFVFHIIFDL